MGGRRRHTNTTRVAAEAKCRAGADEKTGETDETYKTDETTATESTDPTSSRRGSAGSTSSRQATPPYKTAVANRRYRGADQPLVTKVSAWPTAWRIVASATL